MKKLMTILLAALLTVSMAACNGGGSGSGSNAGGGDAEQVAVFWYTNSDVYLSSVRTALDAEFEKLGLTYHDYDANGVQADQTNQIDTAIAAGAKVLAVNQVDSGSEDTAKTILDKAEAAGVKVVFFNRAISDSDESIEKILTQYGSAFVGTDFEQAGHMEGEMVGQYVLEHYDELDLNGDGKISYVMFKGDEANLEAIARTQYGVEDANKVLTAAGKPELVYYDEAATTKYLVDPNGTWSASAANDFMETVLSQYNEANGNMIELVIANNDEMALGAIESLKNHGYNTGDGTTTTIPVFGVDATDSAKAAINAKTMTGTVKQDAEGMAKVTALIAQNLLNGKDAVADIPSDYDVIGTYRVNIPYSSYTGE